ncbi:MAG: alcohol dehydrogenase catalytic domain-containing protein [Tepidisphaeraceae bacterium]|jgi:L-iditol 2-dehydrogenase
MRAARLYGAADLRVEDVPHPGSPGPGQVLLRVGAVGICGSDLHTYEDGRIGDTVLKGPLIMGHEFGGVIEAVGPDAIDGESRPLVVGTPVAVDPCQTCGQCRPCQEGNPNLCLHHRFCGLYPNDGAMCQWMIVPARNCFPVRVGTDWGEVALMETLGVAMHAVDLAQIRVADRVAVLGAGPVGLCIMQCAKLAGASEIYVTDKLPWRLELAGKFGGVPLNIEKCDATAAVRETTAGGGVDVVIEAARAGPAVQQAAEMVRAGGRLTLVGIPGDDRLEMRHSLVRRKGLTIRVARRMKHVYPRVLRLYRGGRVDLKSLISHRFPLAQAGIAMAMNARYEQGVVKVVVEIG